jgi:hypothetical protein
MPTISMAFCTNASLHTFEAVIRTSQMQPSPLLRFNVAHSTDPLLEQFLAEALG